MYFLQCVTCSRACDLAQNRNSRELNLIKIQSLDAHSLANDETKKQLVSNCQSVRANKAFSGSQRDFHVCLVNLHTRQMNNIGFFFSLNKQELHLAQTNIISSGLCHSVILCLLDGFHTNSYNTSTLPIFIQHS